MPLASTVGDYVIDFDGFFPKGCKSDSDPSQLPPGYFWNGINVINQGGLPSCRPGQRCVITLPDGNLQGAAILRPLVGLEQIVFAVDGLLYASVWPFDTYKQIPGIKFSPYARMIYWALATQSAERVSLEAGADIRVIDQRAVLFAQDGGFTAPAYYDGAKSGHVTGDPFGTPSGGPMVWVGDRLWVASKNQVFASDINNPFSFREQVYLGGVSSFFFASEVTAMVKTPSIESPQLMVFTDIDGSILQANVRDRDAWPTTPLFQEEVVQVGCLAHRSALSHYGRLIWFSPSGVSWFDPALSGKITTRLPIRDNEMLLSKTQLGGDLSGIAGTTFGQYMLMSVPAEDSYNKHTWVLNHASVETVSDESGPSWCGYWLGTRPVEWLSGPVAGKERIYHVSVDTDGKNRLWESFQPERLDNGCPITWAIETRGYFGQTSVFASKYPGSRCRLAWVDIALAGISEDLDFGVFYAGGTRGAYKPMLVKRVNIARGSLKSDVVLTSEDTLFACKPQSRTLRTEDANQQAVPDACDVEREDIEGVDESFQLLIVGQGPATIRWVWPFGLQVPVNRSGDGRACESEAGVNVVRFDGMSAHSDAFSDAIAQLVATPLQHFISNKTAVLDQGGMSAVGVGFGESIISQEAADRVAQRAATRQAEIDLSRQLPPILSMGLL